MGSYGFCSEIEPKISKAEQYLLREVIAKAEVQMEEAIAFWKIRSKTKQQQPLISP